MTCLVVMAAQLYLASAVRIGSQQSSERDYLSRLAHSMRINPPTVATPGRTNWPRLNTRNGYTP